MTERKAPDPKPSLRADEVGAAIHGIFQLQEWIATSLGPSLTLRAFVIRKASLALFVLASQEPFLTLAMTD